MARCEHAERAYHDKAPFSVVLPMPTGLQGMQHRHDHRRAQQSPALALATQAVHKWDFLTTLRRSSVGRAW